MLTTIFLFCSVIGGTVMLCQFAMAILGAGDDAFGDFDGDVGGDVDFDAGDAGDGGNAHDGHHHTSWLFGVLSFRTITAAITFFGLGGYAVQSTGQSDVVSLLVAIVCGVAAMYAVYALMRAMYRLQSTGNQDVRTALGQRGAVLVPVPPNLKGVGKVHVTMQGRLVEFAASTDHNTKLKTGARVEVVEITGPDTVRIVPVTEEQLADSELDSTQRASAG